MPEAVAQLQEAHVRRLARLDPLVRVRDLDLTSEAVVEWSSDRQAVGVVDVQETDPESEAGLWAEDRLVRIQVRAATDDDASACGDLLERCHRLGAGAGASHLTVAARDTAMVRPLLLAGYAPTVVLAVHQLSRADVPISATPGHADSSTIVREAGPEDLDAAVAASAAVQAFDTRVGSLPERPHAADTFRPAIDKALHDRRGWSWVAERDGRVVGFCQMEPPEDAKWVTGEATSPSAAYLGVLHVDAGARGDGVGARLVAAAHLRAVAAGAQAVLLHHGAANPLSVPFWGRAGYRPLLTGWSRHAP
jgi:GNAT superfamily N-acetyltransferase